MQHAKEIVMAAVFFFFCAHVTAPLLQPVAAEEGEDKAILLLDEHRLVTAEEYRLLRRKELELYRKSLRRLEDSGRACSDQVNVA